jgi:hypothetical protein
MDDFIHIFNNRDGRNQFITSRIPVSVITQETNQKIKNQKSTIQHSNPNHAK